MTRRTITRTCSQVTTVLGSSPVIETLGLEDGPTMVVVGGHHGDEPAGYAAAGILAANGGALRGRLIVIPQANPAACAMFSRYSPSAGEADLNRCYRLPAEHRDAQCDGAIHAAALLAAVRAYQPDVVIDLHETMEGHPARPSADAAIWAFADTEAAQQLAGRVGLPTLFAPNPRTFTGSLSAAGVAALAVETAMGRMLGARIRGHIGIVAAVADVLGIGLQLRGETLARHIGEGM